MADLRNAWPTLREAGWRTFLAKALDATVYSRLILYTRPVGDAPAPALPPSVSAGWVASERVAALERDRPGITAAARERATRGDRCFAIELDGELRNVRWIAVGRAWIDHLSLELPLGPHGAYHYDLWTHPETRRRGLSALGDRALLAELARAGVTSVTRAIVPWNAAGIGSARAAGFREAGTAFRAGLGALAWRGVRRRPLT